MGLVLDIGEYWVKYWEKTQYLSNTRTQYQTNTQYLFWTPLILSGDSDQSTKAVYSVDSTPTKNATESLNAKGDGFLKSSDQSEMSQSDKDVLGYVSNF